MTLITLFGNEWLAEVSETRGVVPWMTGAAIERNIAGD